MPSTKPSRESMEWLRRVVKESSHRVDLIKSGVDCEPYALGERDVIAMAYLLMELEGRA